MSDPIRRRHLAALSHLAIWPGLYVVGSVWYVASLGGVFGPSIVKTLVFSFAVGVGTYLLDRVKLRDAWLDPADAEAHPRRFAFIADHAGAIRIGATASLALAAAAGATGFAGARWLWRIPPASCVGVITYAATPRGRAPRPKDVFVLKNAYVAGGMAAFACIVVLGATQGGVHRFLANAPLWGFLAATLGARVFIDAALCDLDDRAADEHHSTVTFPVRFGDRRALDAATSAHLLLAGTLAVVPIGPEGPRLAWAGISAASAIALRMASPRRVRDLVDARLVIEALCVAVLLGLFG